MKPTLSQSCASPLRLRLVLGFACGVVALTVGSSTVGTTLCAQEHPEPQPYRLPPVQSVAQQPALPLTPPAPIRLPPIKLTESVAEPLLPPAQIPTPRQIPNPANESSDAGSDGFSVQIILNTITSPQIDPGVSVGNDQWWASHVQQSMRYSSGKVSTTVDDLVRLALENSAQLQVYSEVPRIRETAITEADAAFDWTDFVRGIWEDTDEPVGNSLTVGGSASRFQEHNVSVDAGFRRKNRNGADLALTQQFGHRNNNSTFFVPNNQGNAQLSLSFTQPLLKGRGQVYNTSLTVLASIDTKVARDEYERQLESHLLEVARAYWALYLERGSLTQKVKLYQHTKRIVEHLELRQHIDAQRTQLISAQAALAERKSDLVRARAAVHNSETRIRGLLNAPALGTTDQIELLPVDPPTTDFIPFTLHESLQTAIQHRSEVQQAIKQIKAGCIRLDMAKHEMQPVLNLITETYLSGLNGSSDVGQAWVQQFSEGLPSYSIGLEYELPAGRRASSARLRRRRIELRQLNGQYRNAMETVKNEVEIAVREVNTAYSEMQTKVLAMKAAREEAAALEHRWQQLANVNTSSVLTLESLLRAQERTTQAEYDFLSAQLTYNLALIHMKRAMGVLVHMDCRGAIASVAP